MSGKTVVIIPARGGSKRIPNKNTLPFCGKPMIAWTIEAALELDFIDQLVISTDSEEIAEVSRSYGASVPFLRASNFDDITPVSEATIGSLVQAENYHHCHFDTVIQLLPNCPLRTSADIVDAYNTFQSQNNIFQISCFPFLWMNPWWAVKLSSDGKPACIFPEALKSRSQDLPELYCPTGAIWIAKRDALVQTRTFYGTDYRFCPMNWKSAMDIDTYDDLELAQAIASLGFRSSVLTAGINNE